MFKFFVINFKFTGIKKNLYLYSVPTQDQALQQVIMLKKELAEIKANQALSENSELSSGLEREVSRARGMLGSVNAEADMERSAHRETMDALDASESSVSSRLFVKYLYQCFMNGSSFSLGLVLCRNWKYSVACILKLDVIYFCICCKNASESCI